MTTDTVEIYKSKRALRKRTQWRWRYVRNNGKILANSAESYANFEDLLGSLATVLGVTREYLIDTQVTVDRLTTTRLVRAYGPVVMVVVKR